MINLRKLKKLKVSKLNNLAQKIRKFMISSVSKTGGHIGANLATIEISIAIHKFFNSPKDKIIFDTGHQGYTHKILTGRLNRFKTLNKHKGLSRFIKRSESSHDIIDASHAGTAFSIASGLAYKFINSKNRVCVLIGDGSINEGMSFEGLNFLADKKLPITIVINDNQISISKNIGAIKNLFVNNSNDSAKNFFKSMGFDYFFVKEGHDVEKILSILKKSSKSKKIPIIHVKTEKGKGLKIAKKHQYKMHFSLPFDPSTGHGVSPTISGNTYGKETSKILESLIKKDKKIYIITPATPYASYLDDLIKKYRNKIIDVGMAEQHAVGFASGLSLSGFKPIVCIQSTFLQRAFDQLIHDAAFMNLPIVFLCTRSGFSGYDSPTHHGIYDIPYLRSIPNLEIFYPINVAATEKIIKNSFQQKKNPKIILQPYEQVEKKITKIFFSRNKDFLNDVNLIGNRNSSISLICLPNQLNTCLKILEKNKEKMNLLIIQKIKPFPEKILKKFLKNSKKIISIEEGTIHGGLGSIIAEFILDNKLNKNLLRIGVNDVFIEPGDKYECSKEAGISYDQTLKKINKFIKK